MPQAMVERAANEFPCQSQKLYVSILNGTLWVDQLTTKPPGGWYPAELGGGEAVGYPHFCTLIPGDHGALHYKDLIVSAAAWPDVYFEILTSEIAWPKSSHEIAQAAAAAGLLLALAQRAEHPSR